MTLDPARVPVIVGAGQAIERDDVVSCVDLMARAAESALAVSDRARARIQRVTTVDVLNDTRSRPATELAARLGIDGAECETTVVGGNTPQWLITRTAEAVASGELDVALLAGAEVGRSSKRGGHDRDVTEGPADPVIGADRPGIGPAEAAVRLMLPIHVYPLFESAMAARDGRDFPGQRRHLGDLMAPFTSVAAKHPYAWFPVERTARELATPTEENRLIAEPYTKRMNAIMAVDQGAALLVTSLAVARELGVAQDAVFVWSGADATDVWYPTQRPELDRSPAIRAAGAAALEAAGVDIDQIDHLDLYSCFPSAVQAGAEALGLALDDPRGLTVTGGLPYFGGPGNNYPMHAVATMVDRLREGGGLALTTGLGWYITKHSVGVYGAAPPAEGFRRGATTDAQVAIDATAVPLAEAPRGEAVVDASTVVYDRDGSILSVPVVAHLSEDGRRFAARLAEDETGPHLAARPLVGAGIAVDGDPPTFRIESEP